MEWAKTRPSARFDLAGSNVLACDLDDIRGARDALSLSGRNDNGYAPLMEAIAARYKVDPACVTTAHRRSRGELPDLRRTPGAWRRGPDGASGIRPPARRRSARSTRGRSVSSGRSRTATRSTPIASAPGSRSRTRLVIITSPHNPSSATVDLDALREVGRLAEGVGAYVLVDEVYLDAAAHGRLPAAVLGERFISTSSLTKSYGLSSLRCGWAIAAPDVAERIRRARDVIDGNGSVPAERLATLALEQIDLLLERSTSLLAANGRRLRAFLDASPELEYVDPGGGTVIFPRIKGVDDTRCVRQSDCWRSARPQSSRATSSRRRPTSASGLAA